MDGDRHEADWAGHSEAGPGAVGRAPQARVGSRGFALGRFIAHPPGYPIRVRRRPWRGAPDLTAGLIGLRVRGRGYQSPGTVVTVDIEAGGERHRFDTQVVMVCPAERRFELGLWVEDPEAGYRLRMVEQICHIESYRRRVERREGRRLSTDAAAAEWIERYAAGFPAL